jgi:hypothetical protein
VMAILTLCRVFFAYLRILGVLSGSQALKLLPQIFSHGREEDSELLTADC